MNNDIEIFKGIKIYAKMHAIRFSQWHSSEGFQQYDEVDRWISLEYSGKKVWTTGQLYNEFIKVTSKNLQPA